VAKTRSPNYPSSSLADAIAKVRVIYQKDYKNKMARSVVAKHLGYNSINGASLTAISNLIKYGLLEGRGEDLQVTGEAVTILVEPEPSKERREALRRAALKPALFAQLHKHFGDSLPSVENLSAYLQRNGFNPTAASAATRAYRDTFNLVTSEEALYNAPAQAVQGVMTPEPTLKTGTQAEATNVASESFRQRVSPTCVAEVTLEGEATQQAIDKLIAYLNLMKDTLPN
jgi:hypothetical protein